MSNNFVKQAANIKVIGVGGGGCNAVNRMIEDKVEGVEFIVANTDAQVLAASSAEKKVVLGANISKGLGAGANPEVGKQAALESESEIREILKDADLIFVASGMGGGTGTGAAPEIARIAMETGALVIAIVTKPFGFEGRLRNSYAIKGIDELKKFVDSIIVISNDRLLEIIGGIPVKDSFREADNILKQGVQTITDLIAVPATINLDFADVRTIMKGKGNALFGIGIGSGPDKAIEAANKAITSALLETSIRGAKDAIVNVTGGPSTTLNDAEDAADIIKQASGQDINLIFGIAISENLGDELIVTVIATGFDNDHNKEISSEQHVEVVKPQNIQNHVQEQNMNVSNQRNISNDDYIESAQEKRTSFLNDENNKRPSYVQQQSKISENEMKNVAQRMENWKEGNVSQQRPQVAQKIEDTVDDEDGDFPPFLRKKW
ncbi:cell division protein FtsZ [Spiroplasma tabanidicola]|uniref:Cell division protein FtsZ n=1 Tax=Spiroplasma tabanidicola TaxID=324079 RepID=A0A6I6CCZ1_9MOLU|nr:cell division protein FtsZ [Spiroplasma tabanidicola]QGS52158.1 cell division protein FtsZ [Spiroplasma tabanidicola]